MASRAIDTSLAREEETSIVSPEKSFASTVELSDDLPGNEKSETEPSSNALVSQSEPSKAPQHPHGPHQEKALPLLPESGWESMLDKVADRMEHMEASFAINECGVAFRLATKLLRHYDSTSEEPDIEEYLFHPYLTVQKALFAKDAQSRSVDVSERVNCIMATLYYQVDGHWSAVKRDKGIFPLAEELARVLTKHERSSACGEWAAQLITSILEYHESPQRLGYRISIGGKAPRRRTQEKGGSRKRSRTDKFRTAVRESDTEPKLQRAPTARMV